MRHVVLPLLTVLISALIFAWFITVLFRDNGKMEIKDKAFDSTISKTTYEGHQYILWKFDRSYAGGVVHDPECPKCK